MIISNDNILPMVENKTKGFPYDSICLTNISQNGQISIMCRHFHGRWGSRRTLYIFRMSVELFCARKAKFETFTEYGGRLRKGVI